MDRLKSAVPGWILDRPTDFGQDGTGSAQRWAAKSVS